VRNEVMVDLGYSSKLNAEWAFLEWLRDAGRAAAEVFLRDHAEAIGKRSSLDIDAMLARL
jgi:NTE family protein